MRHVIIQKMKEELMKYEEVLSFFEAGSAAFQRNDEYSDIDMGIIVKDDFLEQAINIVESTISAISPLEQKYVIPQPTWHGHWQAFYHLKDTSPYLLLDVVILKESTPDTLAEVEVHGNPIVYFDKTGVVGTEHIDYAQLRDGILKRIDSIKFISGMLSNFVEKEIKRSRLIDAIDFYNNMFLRSLVTLLRIKYDPTRFSWGNRYLTHVLPEDIYNEIQDLFFIQDAKDLDNKQKIVMLKIHSMLKEDLLVNVPMVS